MSARLNQINAPAVARHFDALLGSVTEVLNTRNFDYWLPDAEAVDAELEKLRSIALRLDAAVDAVMGVMQSDQSWPDWTIAAQMAPARALVVGLCAGYLRFAGCQDDVGMGVAATLRRLLIESRAFLEAFNRIVRRPGSTAAQIAGGMVEVKWTLTGQPELGRLTALLTERGAQEEALRRADEESDSRRQKRNGIVLGILLGIGLS